MGLSCGLIGISGCGKTTIFNAITAAGVSGYGTAEMNHAIAKVPDERFKKLVEMYHPRKQVPANLDVVDIPGLKPDSNNTGGSGFKQLGHIKNVEALLHVVRCFDDPAVPYGYDTVNPVRDVETVDLELMAADSVTLKNKIERMSKKAKTGDKDAAREVTICEKVLAALEQGIPARRQEFTQHELNSLYECNLVSQKPVLYVANVKSLDSSNKHVAALTQYAQNEKADVVVISGKDEAEISQLAPEDRPEFLKELGLQESSMERLLNTANKMLKLVTFFTVGEDEVRAWNCKRGDKAPQAAGKIHTDMEKGFVRMEVIHYSDLIELGSEDAVSKAGKQHLEGKEYEVQDGDIVVVRFNKSK